MSVFWLQAKKSSLLTLCLYLYIWRSSLVLELHRIINQFYKVRSCAPAETLMRWPLSRQLVPQQIWIWFQSINVREQVLLVVCCLGMLLSGFWCGIANTYYIVTLLSNKLRMKWQTPFRDEQAIHFFTSDSLSIFTKSFSAYASFYYW